MLPVTSFLSIQEPFSNQVVLGTIMSLPWTSFALSSIAAAVLTVQYAPQYSLSTSYAQSSLIFFVILGLAGGTWRVILYPKLFDPLRHLPSPPVSLYWGP